MLMNKLIALVLSVALLSGGLFGCTPLGPNFETPEHKTPSGWSMSKAALFQQPSEEESISWWTQFNDPNLNSLIELAYKQNLDLQTAAVRIVGARAQLAKVQGNLYPQSQNLNGNLLSIGVTDSTPGDRNYNIADVGFDVSWEMDFWGKYRRSIQSADANLLASVADYEDILVTLTAEVARTYIQMRTLEERIRLAKKNAKLQEDSLNIVQLQFEAGVVTELDVLQARTLLLSTQATVPNFEASLATTRNGLALLLGLLPEELQALVDNERGIPLVSSTVAVELPAELLRRRPDVRRSEMRAAAQSEQIGIALSELYPSFSLLGSVGWSATDNGSNHLGDIFESKSFFYTFGPSFTWKLFNYGRLKNEVRVQDAEYQQAVLNYRNTVLNAAREVEDAMQNLFNAHLESRYLRENVIITKKSTELSMLQYTEGFIDYQRVLDSIRSLTQKQDQYAANRGRIATNTVALYKAFGGGWLAHADRPLLSDTVRREMIERSDWGSMLENGEKAP